MLLLLGTASCHGRDTTESDHEDMTSFVSGMILLSCDERLPKVSATASLIGDEAVEHRDSRYRQYEQ